MSSFDDLKALFKTWSTAPFTEIYFRTPNKKGDFLPLTFDQIRSMMRSGQPVVRTLAPDESDYLGIITLIGSAAKGKTYVFKLRKDGSVVYKIPFEFDKQPIQKWVKLISRWFIGSYLLDPLRHRQQFALVKEELMMKTWSKFDDDQV